MLRESHLLCGVQLKTKLRDTVAILAYAMTMLPDQEPIKLLK